MESERIRVFDADRNPIGIASREEVHRIGYWHEVFHCWIISDEAGVSYIYLQLRSEKKKDYPGLFDITAAGHLLANETIRDGVREIKEEIGISLTKQTTASPCIHVWGEVVFNFNISGTNVLFIVAVI